MVEQKLVNFKVDQKLLRMFDKKLEDTPLDRTAALTTYMASVITGTMNIQVIISLSGEDGKS